MKLFLSALALFVSSSAFAGPSVGITHDHDYGSETKVYVEQATRVGTFDAGLLSTRYPSADNANGYDVGYSNGLSYGPVGLTGRIGYGRLNNIDKNGGGFVGNTSYFSLGAEAAMPITQSLNAFVNYRHRNSIAVGKYDGPTQNRFQAGVEYAVTKSISTRLGVSHARQVGQHGTGVTANVAYTF